MRKGVPVLTLIFILSLLSILSSGLNIKNVKASGTIYIRADGSVEGTADISTVDNVTYTFTGNINDSIVVERSNIIIDGAGYTLNGTGTGLFAGLMIEYVAPTADDNVTVKNVNIMGFGVGIGLISTENITISLCNITDNMDGIWFGEVMNCTISGNLIADNTNGVYLGSAWENAFYMNNITDNTYGIWIEGSSSNYIFENNITNNDNGVRLLYSTDNKLYHNWFVNNVNHTYIDPSSPNAWNEIYPIGGNFWDNFTERYPGVGNDFSGPNQDIPGSDGFWDGPYENDMDNIDHHPIVPEVTSLLILPLLMVTTFLVTLVIKKKKA